MSSKASTVCVVAVSSEAAAAGIAGSDVRKVVSSSCCGERRRAGVCSASAPNSVLVPISVIATGTSEPISSRGAITCTACRYGVRPTSCPGSLPGFSSSTSTVRPTDCALNARHWRVITACSRCSRSDFSAVGNLVVHLGGRRARARRIHERIGGGEADLVHQRERVAEIVFGLARKADDEIGGEREIGAAGAQARDHVEIVFARMPAVHRRQNAVGAGLHRQMHIGHQRRQIAVRGDQIVVHVARMAGRVAQAHDAGHVAETAQQPAERRRRARRRLAHDRR